MELKFSLRTLVLLSGGIWMGIGIFLLTLGIHFLTSLPTPSDAFSLLTFFAPLVKGREQAFCLIVVLALFVGILKGRTVLKKAAQRQIVRLGQLQTPASLKHLYTPTYYLLIASMIVLGISLRYLPLSLDTRGAIDLTIGCALTQGALHYFRFKTSP